MLEHQMQAVYVAMYEQRNGTVAVCVVVITLL
jgi:hypothetical protein